MDESVNKHVFISYSREDRQFVEQLIADLSSEKITVWIDTTGLKPGTRNWEKSIKGAIRASYAMLLIASPASYQSDFVQGELEIAKMYERPIFPLWSSGKYWADCIPLDMVKTQYIDCREDKYNANLLEVISTLENIRPIHSENPKENPDFISRNPYRGLLPFTSQQKNDFFGREQLITDLIQLVPYAEDKNRFLAVIGPSGSGKSSLVMAGLLPQLQQGALPRSDQWIYLSPIVPGIKPIENLTLALKEVLPDISLKSIEEDLENSSRGLHLLANFLLKDTNKRLVIFVDQFEELFTQTVNEDERKRFINLLVHASTEMGGRVIWLLTLRADFYHRPMDYRTLAQLIEEQRKDILPMTLVELRDVIQKPAQLPDVQLTFDDGLVGDLLFEVNGQAGALPLLQFTLDQLYERRRGNQLTLKAYHEIGGVQGALAQHAEKTFSNLPSEQHQQMARHLFLRLIDPGLTEQDTRRRRAPLHELEVHEDNQGIIMDETAGNFIQARLLTTNKIAGIVTIEVSHEALIREWKRLYEWLQSARDDVRFQQLLSNDVQEWFRQGRRADNLYRGAKLIEAKDWASRNRPSANEIDFIHEATLLEENLSEQSKQITALSEVSSQITSNLNTDDVLAIMLEALSLVIPYDGVTVWLHEGTRLRAAAARGYRHSEVASPEELVGLYSDIDTSILFKEMVEGRQVINARDVGKDQTRFPHGAIQPYKNWLGVPLFFRGETIGVIIVEKQQSNFYTAHHEKLLLTFANQAAVALNNARLFEELDQRAVQMRIQAERLELVNRVAVSLAQSLDIESILEITLRETAVALEIQEAVALIIDRENDLGRIIVEYPLSDDAPNKVSPLADNRVIARICETLLPFIIEDFQNSPLAEHVRPFMRTTLAVHSALTVPLVAGGMVIAVMQFSVTQTGYDFSEERLEIAQTFASQAAIAVQNASLFEQSVIRNHELETLFEAAQATAGVTLDLNEAMQRVVGQMLSALRADACSIALWDDIENKLEVHSAINAWGDATNADAPGTSYELNEYPVRERVLRQRQVVALSLEQKDLDISEMRSMEQNGATSRLLIPLVVNDISIGLVELELHNQDRVFETADIRLARSLASSASVAIENARLQTETRSQIEELYILQDLSTAVSSTVDLKGLFPMVRDQLPVLLDADIFYVALFDNDANQFSFPISIHREHGDLILDNHPVGKDEFSYVIRRRAPLLLAGSQFKELRHNQGITESLMPEAKCFLGVPMLSGNKVVGVLAAQDNENAHAFGLNDQRILTTVAAQLSVAIENARLYETVSEYADGLEKHVLERTYELERERERLATLYEITSEVAASLDIQRILSVALKKVAKAIDATMGVILGIDEISEHLFVLHAFGEGEPTDEAMRTQLAQDEGLAGWMLQNKINIVIDDVQNDPRWLVRNERDRRQRAAVASLLQGGDDVRGVMMLFSSQPSAFNEDHLKLVAAAASQLANAMNNSELYSLIRDQAERVGAILRTEQIESTKNTAIISSVADGVMYANENGTVVLYNNAAERILQLPAEHAVNRHIRELAGLYSGGGREWLDAINRWTKEPASYREGDFVEIVLILEDRRIVNVRLSPVNMGDQFLGTVSVFRDITKLMEVDRLKTEFVSTVSHELRTPMTSIKGYADLLLLGTAGEVSEAQQHLLENIKQNADRLSILVNDLLEVSKIDQNRVALRFTEVEVPDLLELTRNHIEECVDYSNKMLHVSVQLEANLPKIWADYDKIFQVMQNLGDNAFNYTHASGAITLAAQRRDNFVVLSVADTGVGIPEEIQGRVFERFFRGHEYENLVMDTPGTGLGLSIVKSLVEMHNGEIWFESQVGVGTTFYIKIPAVKHG